MKTTITLLIVLCFTIHARATHWRVNNNFGIVADFNSIQNAHNSAAAGDTIYIESSASSYGSMTCSKSLVWIGMGYFIDANSSTHNPGLQFHTNGSNISALVINAGSANSVFMGLTISGVYISSSNIDIARCNIGTIEFYANQPNLTSNFSLRQSMVSGNISQYYYNAGSSISTGFAFTNNILLGGINLPTNYQGIIMNGNYIASMNTLAFVVSNNIIYGSGSPVFCVYASNVYNNLFLVSSNTNYVGNNGNIFSASNPNTSSNTVFNGATSFSYDSWVNLKPGSLALGAGLNGTDIGPRGGATPYKLSGIPNVPTISQFLFRSTPSNTLPVTISTRSNSGN